METISQLFQQHLSIPKEQITSIKRFDQGFLNDNYLVTLMNQQQYVTRITKPNLLVNRSNEYQILLDTHHSKDFYYFDLAIGNYVRNFYPDEIQGNVQKCNEYLHPIIKAISSLHSNQPHFDYPFYNYGMYVDYQQLKPSDSYLELYQRIMNHLKDSNLKMVISHNDLNPTNIIGYHQEASFIDFEFACLNYDYFDYAYFFKELFLQEQVLKSLCEEYQWDYQIMLSFVYLTTYISYAWANQMPTSDAINLYRSKIQTRLDYYYELIKSSL